jgi:hypothetical protein
MNQNIKEALDKIIEKDLSGMRDAFASAITTKAVDKLEERKIEIGKSYFGIKG